MTGRGQGSRDRVVAIFKGRSKAVPVQKDTHFLEVCRYVVLNPVRAKTVRHPQWKWIGYVWTVEHGARGGDELNHPEAGKNYGWPVISYGTHYSFAKIGEGTAKQGMEQPVYYWDPVIAPSGMVIYTGDLFPGWKGNYLIGSLTPGGLVRLVMKDGKVAQEERYRGDLDARIRDVRQAPDGSLYLLADARDGQILRVTPATR